MNELIPLSINPNIPLDIEVSASHIFFTASSEITEQGGIELASDEPPPSCRIASFDWDSLVEPHLPSDAPLQIKVKVGQYTIARCIVDEGALVIILSAHSWRGMGSPKLVSTTSSLLYFDRRTSISLRILAQTPITLGGNTTLVYLMVIEDPLDFNMLLGHDYVYAMQVMVSTFFV